MLRLESVKFTVLVPKPEVKTEGEAIVKALEFVRSMVENGGVHELKNLPIRPMRWEVLHSEGSNWDIIISF